MPYPGQIPFPTGSAAAGRSQAGRPVRPSSVIAMRTAEAEAPDGFWLKSMSDEDISALNTVKTQYMRPGRDGVRLPPGLTPKRLPSPMNNRVGGKRQQISKGWANRYKRGMGPTNG